MPSFTLTDEQQQIVSSMRGPDPVIVQAYAGTAKTTSIVAAAPQVRVPALALAFNKKIAEDLKGKLPQNWRVMTLNGLGQLAWIRSLPASVSLEVDDRKLGRLVSSVSKDNKVELSSEQWGQVRQLVSKAQLAGLSPGDLGQPFVPDSEEVWSDLAFEAWIANDDRGLLIDLARQTLVASIDEAKRGRISFDDQIYCPTILGGSWPRFPAAAGDETQDWSILNQRMFALATRDDAKILLVGDPKQAIYGWRGADLEAMTTLRRLRPGGWDEKRLTLSFRCPRRIVARQQHHAPGFQAAASNRDGRFEDFRQIEFSREGDYLDGGWGFSKLRGLGDGSAVILCRNNAPLLSLAFKLLRQQIAPVVLGRDIGKGLSALSRKIAKDDATSAEIFLGRLAEWEASEVAAATASGESEAKLDSILDRSESLRAVIDGSQCQTAGDLRAALALLFQRASGEVVLSTIHRAKGLEWDLVCHLDPWRVPSRQAKKRAREGDPAALEQEWNLKYVCETRTRDVLVQANLEDFR